MTLQEAKDQIARKEGHADWLTLRYRESSTSVDLLWEQVAELYARSKWDECFQYCGDKSYDSIFPSKPEFKP